jgi:hypothetical protein
MSTVTRTLNVGKRLPELTARLDRAERNCSLLGWPDARRQLLVDGADLRDVLRGIGPEVTR